jgi:ferredoxin
MGYKLEHDRANCISCGGCASVHPDRWKMDEKDGKSDIIDSKMREDGWEELDIDEEEFHQNKEAADICPVNVIHITDKEKKERLI